MGQRSVRVNELVKREISLALHTLFQTEATLITITSVEVAPDLRQARVFFSVIGDPQQKRQASRLLSKHKNEIRRHIAKKITLKYLPHLKFTLDSSSEKAIELIDKMQEIQNEEDSL